MEHKRGVGSVAAAKQVLAGLPVDRQTESVPLKRALGRVLAENFTARIPVPSFDKSAFDGYALRREDIAQASKSSPVTLNVIGTVAAGEVFGTPVSAGQTARIMTGAPVPPGANVVIKYEDTEFTDKTATFFAPAGKRGNIVQTGEDIPKGALLIEAGTMLCAPEVAAIAAQGFETARVYKQPVATVISTGSELMPPGAKLEPGKIYNSNGPLIRGFLEAYGIGAADGGTAPDDPDTLAAALVRAFDNSDAVITTGGVSAGDFDYLERAAVNAGADILFHKLPFKPGGAILAAIKNNKLLLGLSGNPSAAATGLLLLGMPYLKRLCGFNTTEFLESDAALEAPFNKSSKNLRLLWGKKRIIGGRLIFCQSQTQGNGAVSAMLGCNLLGIIPAGSGPLTAGSVIKVYIL